VSLCIAPVTPRDLTAAWPAVSFGLVRGSADTQPLMASDGEIARAIASAPAGAAQAEESELYRRFARRVRLYGLKHLRDDAAADDLAQEVLLVTIERLRAGEVRNPDEIGSFILGTSRMLAGSTARKTRRREHLTAQFHVPELYAEPDVPSGDIDIVEGCLHRLAERDHRILVLSFYVEKTSPEIAKELGVTGTVVRVARHRALERLRDCVRLRQDSGGQVGFKEASKQ
jgi:RNA polymerase sigma-70 factor (ECF subfamily)